jgi:hypothetical protein
MAYPILPHIGEDVLHTKDDQAISFVIILQPALDAQGDFVMGEAK